MRLRHLDAADAERAIRGPLQLFNERSAAAPVTIEDQLVERVLEDTRTGRVRISEIAGAGVPLVDAGHHVEASFLQLVLNKLWDAEMQAGSRVLRLATLQRLGGAEKIVQDHVAAEMHRLSDDERNLSANMFRFLVMPAGGKIAQLTDDLAAVADRPREEVVPVLEKLASVRILSRSYPPERYEIFHDVLAPAVLDWRAKHQKAQERAAAELRAEIEARNARRFRSLAIALAVMFVLAVAAGIAAHERAMESRARELAATALSQLSTDPERGLILAMYGLRGKHTREAEDALHRTGLASRGRRTGPTGDRVMLQMAVRADCG